LKSLNKSSWIALFVVTALIYGAIFGTDEDKAPESTPTPAVTASPTESAEPTADPTLEPSAQPSTTATVKKSQALRALAEIPIKGRAPKTGYSRDMFADGWGSSFGCDTRNRILRRDLIEFRYRSDSACIIESGVLNDPFTGQTIAFQRGVTTSLAVQIDHVVSLSDAWQKGAQQLSSYQRYLFYNDPLNLLAVWGPANSQKSDSDAASWLPSNKSFRCDFVSRQIAVKAKYALWVTQAEHDAMSRVLGTCPKQRLPD
jgi:hypothetical protein